MASQSSSQLKKFKLHQSLYKRQISQIRDITPEQDPSAQDAVLSRDELEKIRSAHDARRRQENHDESDEYEKLLSPSFTAVSNIVH